MTRLIDADKLIKKIKKDKFAYVRSDYQSGYNDGIFHTEIVADNFPTVSVERDIPKAPTDQQLEEDGYGAWGSLYGHCPSCKGPVYYKQNYCEKCGQRLDWGNSDKEIDTVPVIRCKDCKYCSVDRYADGNVPDYVCIEMDCGVEADGFCAWAERKE